VSLVERFRAGDERALARAISLVEQGSPEVAPLLAALAATPASAPVVGITGPPGVGKSTLTAALVAHWRAGRRRLAVLAIDPSSARTGGAALGDRLRLAAHATDPGVFIRSMAARGHLGGLAGAAGRAVDLLAAFGVDLVVVETVGVGQAEIDIAGLADLVVVVQAPGLGDEMQAIKAGVLEVADLIAVNKGDLPGASQAAAGLRALAGAADRPAPPVLTVSAASGAGVADLAAAIDAGLAAGRRRPDAVARAREQVLAAALARLRARLAAAPDLAALSARVAAGTLTVDEAAGQLARAVAGTSTAS
jgi:LAO/AO transport system kinase